MAQWAVRNSRRTLRAGPAATPTEAVQEREPSEPGEGMCDGRTHGVGVDQRDTVWECMLRTLCKKVLKGTRNFYGFIFMGVECIVMPLRCHIAAIDYKRIALGLPFHYLLFK